MTSFEEFFVVAVACLISWVIGAAWRYHQIQKNQKTLSPQEVADKLYPNVSHVFMSANGKAKQREPLQH